VTARAVAAATRFSGADFRRALGAFATGVTVITTRGDGHDYGMTATAFSSVSLDPPLVLVCVRTGALGANTIQQNGVFAVNILSAEQEAIATFFASRDRPRGRDAFTEIRHREVASGAPVLDGVTAFVDCRLRSTHEEGDHLIFIGDVVAIGVEAGVDPLLFHGGGYRVLEAA
jgi:flavin reductase (DIM6/NTAB) family NADH-FMN oxidoreductase RutF